MDKLSKRHIERQYGANLNVLEWCCLNTNTQEVVFRYNEMIIVKVGG